VAIHDPESGALYVRFRGLNYVRLDVEEKPDLHVFDAVKWRPDMAHVTQNQLLYLAAKAGTRLDEVMDLIAHKTPRLSVLEISLDDAESAEASSMYVADGPSRLFALYLRVA